MVSTPHLAAFMHIVQVCERAATSRGDDFQTLSTPTCAALRVAGDKTVFAFDEDDGSGGYRRARLQARGRGSRPRTVRRIASEGIRRRQMQPDLGLRRVQAQVVQGLTEMIRFRMLISLPATRTATTPRPCGPIWRSSWRRMFCLRAPSCLLSRPSGCSLHEALDIRDLKLGFALFRV